jgi:hypothetical protein
METPLLESPMDGKFIIFFVFIKTSFELSVQLRTTPDAPGGPTQEIAILKIDSDNNVEIKFVDKDATKIQDEVVFTGLYLELRQRKKSEK